MVDTPEATAPQEPTPAEKAKAALNEARAAKAKSAREVQAREADAAAREKALGDDPHQQARSTGVVKNMPFQQGWLLALGQKKLYFSAANSEVQSADDVPAVAREGAVYLNPKSKDIVNAQVLDSYVEGALATDASEEDRLCDLPITYNIVERKPISGITEEEAKAAGYSRRHLMFRLALQSDKSFEFTQLLGQKMSEVIGGLLSNSDVPQQQAQAYAGRIAAATFEGLRFGRIKGDQNIAQAAMQVINTLVSGGGIKDSDIPGEVDMFKIAVATPQQLVEAGNAADEASAKKTIGSSLKSIQTAADNVVFGMVGRDVRDDVAAVYGVKRLGELKAGLSQRIDELLGKEEPSRSHRLDLLMRDLKSYPGHEGQAIEFRERLSDALGNGDVEVASQIEAELRAAYAEAKASAPKPKFVLGV